MGCCGAIAERRVPHTAQNSLCLDTVPQVGQIIFLITGLVDTGISLVMYFAAIRWRVPNEAKVSEAMRKRKNAKRAKSFDMSQIL